jgi:hypothetical protein
MTTTDTTTQDETTSVVGSSTGTNTRTKAELLRNAKAAIEIGDQSFREAAEALAIAQELHGASQAEMARAVGKSEAWVSRLLQWRREGYRKESPFGPTTKAGRLAHAKDRAASGASKPRTPRAKLPCGKSRLERSGAQPLASPTTGQLKASTAIGAGAGASTKALAEFKYAVNLYVPKMNNAAKTEATAYFLEKASVP